MELIVLLTVLSATQTVGNGKYFIEISNNGPACVDSELTFFAHLHSPSRDIDPSELFLYAWRNNVMNSEEDVDVVIAGSRTNLTKVFTQYDVHNFCEYRMDVTVFNISKDRSIPWKWSAIDDQLPEVVAAGMNNFSLTENFRATLELSQNIGGQKFHPADAFVAGHPIRLTASVVDDFINPIFCFHYMVNGQKSVTNDSHVAVVLNSTTENVIELYVVAFVNITDVNKRRHLVSRNSSLISKHPVVCDLLTNVEVRADHRTIVGTEFNALVKCRGSHPFTISWNITSRFNRSAVYRGAVLDIGSCSHVIYHHFVESGSYVLTVAVKNLVDEQHVTFDVNAMPVTTAPQCDIRPSAVVPVMSVVIAVVAVTILFWFYHQSQQGKRIEETADFEFYTPSTRVYFRASPSLGNPFNLRTKEFVKPAAELRDDEELELQIFSPHYGSYSKE